MKNRFTITISDAHGVRHYTFDQLVKRFFWWGLMAVVALLLLALVTIGVLRREIEALEARRDEAVAAYDAALRRQAQMMAALKGQNNQLAHALSQRMARLNALDEKVQALEAILGAEVAPDVPLEARVAQVELTAAERRLLLTLVPSGQPVKVFRGYSSGFGWRKHPVRGTRELHKGLDYRGKSGEPVIATADGVVEYAGYHKASGYGRMVLINHAFGFRTLYGHLKKVTVKSGQVVKKGQLIGQVGNTGLSTGAHLHYEVSFLQRALNPRPFAQWTLKRYDEIFKQVRQVPWGSLASRVRAYLDMVVPPSSPKGATSGEMLAD